MVVTGLIIKNYKHLVLETSVATYVQYVSQHMFNMSFKEPNKSEFEKNHFSWHSF